MLALYDNNNTRTRAPILYYNQYTTKKKAANLQTSFRRQKHMQNPFTPQHHLAHCHPPPTDTTNMETKSICAYHYSSSSSSAYGKTQQCRFSTFCYSLACLCTTALLRPLLSSKRAENEHPPHLGHEYSGVFLKHQFQLVQYRL